MRNLYSINYRFLIVVDVIVDDDEERNEGMMEFCNRLQGIISALQSVLYIDCELRNFRTVMSVVNRRATRGSRKSSCTCVPSMNPPLPTH